MALRPSSVADKIIGWRALPVYYRSSLTATFILALSFAFISDYNEAIPNISSSVTVDVPHLAINRYIYLFFLFAARYALVGTG